MIAQTYKDNERLKKENQELNTKVNTLQGDNNTVKKINPKRSLEVLGT